MRYKFIILFLLIGFVSKAQVYQLMPQYGYDTKRMNFDSTIQIPTFCGVPKLGSNKINKGALAFDSCNNRFYYFNPKTQVWDTIKSADASLFVKYTDTAQMLSAYLQKIDTTNRFVSSVTKLNDSTIQVIKGTTTSNITINSVTSATRLITKVWNNTGATILRGSVVYISGRHSSNLPTIALAEGNNEANSYKTFALVDGDIADNSSGFVIQAGKILGLNLPTSSYTDGDILYLSPTVPGGYTTTKPLAPNHIVKLGSVTRAHPTQGSIEIKIENGWQLDELSDVQIAAVPADSTLLQFSRVDSLWHDVSPLTAMGNRFVKTTDSSAMLQPYLRKIDTASISNRINLKLNISDTSAMLSPYARTNFVNASLATKLNISDTANMLNPYLRKIDTTNRFVTSVFRKTASDSVFFVRGGTNNFAFRDSTGGGNIYNTDGTLTGNRTLSVSNNSLTFGGSANAASGISNPFRISPTLTATANSDNLVGLDINPTFSNGAFTGVQNTRLRLNSATSGTAESLTLFNNDNSGGSSTSIRFRNNYPGTSRIWSSIDFGFPVGGGGTLSFNTSNGIGSNATTKMTIGVDNITSNVVHSFTSGITGGLSVYTGAIGDPAPGIVKNLSTNITTGGANSTASLAVGNVVTQSTNTNAHGIYINNQATVSGTGQRYNIFCVGSALNHFAGNTLIGTTTNDASALLNVTSTTQGFLQPRLTTSQMNAISTPATGLSVFNTTDSAEFVYRGTGGGWQRNWNANNLEYTYQGASGGFALTSTRVASPGNFSTVIGIGANNNNNPYNTFIGHEVGRNMTNANNTQNHNTGVGSQVFYSMNQGQRNTAFGSQAAYNTEFGYDNTYIGYQSGYNLGSFRMNNTFIGSSSGVLNSTGSALTYAFNDIMIGKNTRPLALSLSINEIVIGTDAIGNAARTLTLGDNEIRESYLKGVVSLGRNTGTRQTMNSGALLDMSSTTHGLLIPKVANTTTVGRSVGTFTRVNGSGYTNGTHQNVPLTGGTGTYANADITITGGAMSAVTITNGGGGYTVGDTLRPSGIGSGNGYLLITATNNPVTGLQVFNTTDSANYVYRGSVAGWQQQAGQIFATATLDFPNTLTQTSSDLTITLTGAVDGDAVVLGVPNAAVNANSCFTAWVSAANTVTVRFNNYSSGAINPASATFKVTIIK